MDHIYALLDGLLRPFGEDDKNFIRGYWHTVVQNLLTPYQRQDEYDLAETINYAQLNEKSFYWPFVPQVDTVTYTIASLPETLPRGLYDLVCVGDPVRHEEDLTLPTRIDNAFDVSCESTDVTVDGNIVLGTGVHRVVWWTNIVTNYTFADNVLNSTEAIHTVTAKRGASTQDQYMSIRCEIMADKVFKSEYVTTKYMRVGQPIVVNGLYPDTIAEIIDKYRFRVTDIHGYHGDMANVEIDLFQYIYPCAMETIPSFREGYVSGIDYFIHDGDIYFGVPVDENLIAVRAYRPSTLIYDKFIQYLDEHPDQPELYKVWWHDIFTGGLELFLHAALGYPYTLAEMGNQRCVGFEYTREWGHGLETFTTTGEYNRISGTFSGNETSIRCEDGRMYKIIRHCQADNTVELDRTPHADSFTGESGSFVVSSIILQDDVVAERHFGVPPGAIPIVVPGEIVEPWAKLTTGVRIFDKHDRDDYNDFEDVSRFTVPGHTVTPSDTILSMLAFNTFVIEVDSPFDVEDRLVRYLIPSWAQYHVKNHQERLYLHDFAEISLAATLLFAKILPFDIFQLTSLLPITVWYENQSLIDASVPRKIIGDYAGFPGNITNITDEFGVPLDISVYPASFIADFNADLATELDGTIVSTGLPAPGAPGTFVVTADNGLSAGPAQEYMFMSKTRLHVLDWTGHRSGIMEHPGPAWPPQTTKRVDGVRWYYTSTANSGGAGLLYTPAIYSLGDSVLNDRLTKMEYTAGIGTVLVGQTVSYTDLKRLGARLGMFYKNDTDHITVSSFSAHGEPVLSSVPVHGTLTGTWGFYCFYVEHDDGAIQTYFED